MDDLYQYERELQDKGIKVIGGVDEVGRGPLIGNVIAACVVLPLDFKLEGLTDSKKLSEKKRNEYYEIIGQKALAIGIGRVSEKVIDEVNIYQATKIAMTKAIEEANSQIKIEHILIDAMPLDIDIPTTSIIKGDAKSITIAAASVVAKVIRDNEMYELDKIYPMYDLAKNKGYGTKKHLQAIEEYGITKYHRLTYSPVTKYKNKINNIKKENQAN
ncbi:MAG: ribonuclease HII [Bacilli bacterium]|nr:ribonuclease HII [Bacilli bacterium]